MRILKEHGIRLLVAVAVLSLAAELLLERDGYLAVENWPGFQAGFALVLALLAGLASPLLARLLMREDDDA